MSSSAVAMAKLPEVSPLSPIWPVGSNEKSDRRKPKDEESPRELPSKSRKEKRDEGEGGHIDEYA